MKTFAKSTIAVLFLLCTGSGYAGGHGGGGGEPLCIPIDGTVRSAPDESCGILGSVWNDPNIESPDPFLVNFGLPPAQVCFTIKGKGKAKFEGYSGLTAVPVANPPPPNESPVPVATTPLIFPVLGVRSGLSVFTSQATLTGKLVTGRSGTLYTKDSGVITLPETPGGVQIVGQVLKIVGGTEDFAGATGTIAVAGEEVGGAAFYTGEVCVKPKK